MIFKKIFSAFCILLLLLLGSFPHVSSLSFLSAHLFFMPLPSLPCPCLFESGSIIGPFAQKKSPLILQFLQKHI
jgi:hypothetical protein